MTDKQRVGIAEFRVARAPGILVSYGLGSCLGIVLYDARLQLGGMAHTLLPGDRPGGQQLRPAKYVEGAIRLMIDELLTAGAELPHLTAKLAGGSNMFESHNPDAEGGIGARNVQAGRQVLDRFGIPLVGEDVGGNRGRTIELDLTTGLLRVRSLRTGELCI